MSVYANFGSIKSIKNHQFNEERYQTIGRGHGFSELDGVPFRLSDKCCVTSSDLYKLNDVQLEYSRVIDSTCSVIAFGGLKGPCSNHVVMWEYTFELERKVMSNMAKKPKT